MFGMSGTEIAIIFVLALLLLGPAKLPELARSLGKGLREFRRATDDLRSSVEGEFYRMDKPPGPAQPLPKATDPAFAAAEPAAAPAEASANDATPEPDAAGTEPGSAPAEACAAEATPAESPATAPDPAAREHAPAPAAADDAEKR